MFRLIILLVFLKDSFLNSSAQETISNLVPNISTEKVRYLFVGIDNPVTITTSYGSKYNVSISKGTQAMKNNNRYLTTAVFL